MAFFSGIVRWYNDAGRRPSWFLNVHKAALLYDIYKAKPEVIQEAEEQLAALTKKIDEVHIGIFHRSAGGALTTWAIMEARIVLIAALLLQTDTDKAGLIFYSIFNFQVWLAVVTELFPMEPKLSKFQRRWNKIAERLRAEKDHRDRLAHMPVVQDEEARTLDSRRALSIGNILDTRAKTQALKPMTVDEVIEFRNRIGLISNQLMDLYLDMKPYIFSPSQPTSPQTQAEPPPDLTG